MPSGGARKGAGRPRLNESLQVDNEVINQKIRQAATEGWEVLADRFVDIMKASVDMAVGTKTRLPNPSMLRTLLDLMVRITGPDTQSGPTRYELLIEEYIADSQAKIRESNAGDVAESNPSDGGDSNGGYSSWPAPHHIVPRMGNSL